MELEQLQAKIREYMKERTAVAEKVKPVESLLMGSDADIDAFIDSKTAALGPGAAMIKPIIKTALGGILPEVREVASGAKRVDSLSVELVGFIVEQISEKEAITDG